MIYGRSTDIEQLNRKESSTRFRTEPHNEKYLKEVVDNTRYELDTKMASRIFIMSGIAFLAFVAMLAVSLMWWFSDYYYALVPLTGM